MIARKTLFSSPGGDTVQIESTAKYLRVLGVQVDIRLSGEKIDYDQYKILHFFNIIRPDDILPHIAKTKLPFVISTIYVDYREFEKKNREGVLKLASNIFSGDQLEYLKTIARFVLNGDKINSLYYMLTGQRNSIRHVAKKSAMLLPNSHSEYRRFAEEYKINKPYRSIPNAIDVSIFDDTVVPNEKFKNHVLCVGRIEGRKNQLNLIKAVRDTNLSLTIIGKPSPNHMAYYKACVQLAAESKNVQIIEHISHKELAAIFKAAKVHVLPSWFETTGLSSLEAAIMGCNIVVTRKGDTEEYFEDLAFYCDPENVESIRKAVTDAYDKPVENKLKNKVLECYTWQRAAETTLDAYQAVLKDV